MDELGRKSIYDEWLEYRRQCIPSEATDTLIMFMKRAFYAGAFTLLNLQLNYLEYERGKTAPTDNDLIYMDGLYTELTTFFEKAKRGEQ